MQLPLLALDPEGRIYYYNKKTRETQWEPPVTDDIQSAIEIKSTEVQIETASTASEDDECMDLDAEENCEDSDDEDENDSDQEDEQSKSKSGGGGSLKNEGFHSGLNEVDSDLSETEKLLLLRNSRKKTKEERQHERRQKREQNREKREYEKKRRRERHGKHRRDGLVQEHFIPVSLIFGVNSCNISSFSY